MREIINDYGEAIIYVVVGGCFCAGLLYLLQSLSA